MRPLLLLCAGFLCGLAVAFAFLHKPPEVTRKQEARNPAIPSELDALRAQLKFSEAQVTQLQARNAELEKATAPPEPPAPKNPLAPFMQIAMNQVRQMQDQKFQILKKRLNLTPEQESKLKLFYDKQSRHTQELTKRMMAGEKINPESMKDEDLRSEDQILEETLTAIQKAEHKKMKEEEQASQSEMIASFELSQVSAALNLNDAQKDSFFQAIAEANQKLQTPEGRKQYFQGTSNGDPTQYLAARDKAMLDATKSVLTPEQWETYRQQLEQRTSQQAEMMKAFLPQQ